jgi:hypothetical protein
MTFDILTGIAIAGGSPEVGCPPAGLRNTTDQTDLAAYLATFEVTAR